MASNSLSLLFALFISCLGFVAADADASSKKGIYQHFAITGVHSGVNAATGARPARRNILNMQKDSVTFDLYIQALIAMQNTPEAVLTSWYQIAGIHGRPYTSWDNVPTVNGAPITGYCAHGSVLFPTWHRPYLAMFEQILSDQAQTIALKYYPASLRAQYVAAASNFRIPYWDWATNATIPDVVDSPTITINTPTGAQTVSNPLYSYKFQTFPLDPKYFPASQSSGAYDWYLAKYKQTMRSPNSQGGPSDFAVANSQLNAAGLKYSTYYALTKATTYNNFASQAIWGPSIENVHGLVHVDVGGSWGHMSQLSYSAFDPIFFLHHCNVDRLLALYQAMFPASQGPNYYLTTFPEYYGTYAIAPSTPYGPGPNDTANTPLPPFSTNAQGTFWTSASSQYLSTFGYTYPEIQDWNQTPSQLSSNVTAQVNMMYNPPTPSKRSLSPRSITTDGHEQVLEWSVGLSVSKFEMNGQRFIVRLFVGNIPEDPRTWATSESCAGSFAVLPPPQAPTGPVPDVKAYDEISLMQTLMSVGHDGQDVSAVVGYLKESFEWRVQLMDGTVAPVDQYSSLEIAVQDEIVTLARDIYEIPSYGEKTLHPEITQGKAGGYSARKM